MQDGEGKRLLGKQVVEERSPHLSLKIQMNRVFAPSTKLISTVVALDCEMVGVGALNLSRLARICIVNYDGEIIIDSYCKPREEVTDFRTKYSGILPEHLISAPSFQNVREKVQNIIHGKVLVGHGLDNDLRALEIIHPQTMRRDTALYSRFILNFQRDQDKSKFLKPSLKSLALKYLNWEIQESEHDPFTDAVAALNLYKIHERSWDRSSKALKR